MQKPYPPKDYLNLFCLGNREVRDDNEAPSASAVLENKPHVIYPQIFFSQLLYIK